MNSIKFQGSYDLSKKTSKEPFGSCRSSSGTQGVRRLVSLIKKGNQKAAGPMDLRLYFYKAANLLLAAFFYY